MLSDPSLRTLCCDVTVRLWSGLSQAGHARHQRGWTSRTTMNTTTNTPTLQHSNTPPQLQHSNTPALHQHSIKTPPGLQDTNQENYLSADTTQPSTHLWIPRYQPHTPDKFPSCPLNSVPLQLMVLSIKDLSTFIICFSVLKDFIILE